MIAALLCSPSPGVAATAPNLGSAASFAVLAGSAVTCTNSTVNGDVGVSPGTAVTQTSCTINGTIHANDSVAVQANRDFFSAYDALALTQCDKVLTTLDGQTLSPGVYCFDAAATSTGSVLTLKGPSNGTWIFKIGTLGTGALTGTNFSVIMEDGGQPCNVYWWVAEAATMTDSNFVGTILAGAAITITGGTFTGDAYAKAAVTMTGANVTACAQGSGASPSSIKVTGGGQIPVPDPNSTGRATFGFNAQPDKSGGVKGQFDYVNHVTGLHVNGPVTAIQVIAINPDGSPKTVRFSGTCDRKGPACAFSVTVEDRGEPGTSDQFGIVVTGTAPEARSQRVISRGNIQFHK
jgi:hypothetical protein